MEILVFEKLLNTIKVAVSLGILLELTLLVILVKGIIE